MATRAKNVFVISLGGSIVYPDTINVSFLKKFYGFIKKEIARGNKFIIIVGGGHSARLFQGAAGKIVNVSNEDKDWIGIHATRLNAHLLRTIFKKYAKPRIHKHRKKITSFNGQKVIIGAGWHPGWSTDFVAIQTAIDFGITTMINLGSPDYVYTKDHKKFKNAKPILSLAWKEYITLIPKEWNPGDHSPVDPIASRLAAKHKIKVIVAAGKDLINLEKILRNKSFKGTVIG